MWRNVPFTDDVKGLVIRADSNAQSSVSAVSPMVMAHVTPIAIHYLMYVNPFATYAVKTAQIYSWWYVEIAQIDQA